ncbi:hypothetical protein ACPOM7_14780 [Peribacillus castrilensis]|uniref:Uncharacterized protein n=1 Tax=Peribacillus simplex TaxID=1478 RepID=A0AAN2PCT5_9BACI|nr:MULTISPECIES: hypothetical protein [Bacillaceae]MBD8588028.1 hypothetical protein [Peribacillus simplex]MEA3575313.1 hypothetical protein [Peribacillus frigoritolerans]CEG24964.1 hypothetical protein BN1180_05809 [Peribacillus simplex]CRH70194.1 Uncharacterised protein [Chlamydia trachomatis]
MKFAYEHQGDILYQVENYKFRYQGVEKANIELMYFLDDEAYAFQFNINDNLIPEEFRFSANNNRDLCEKIGVDFQEFAGTFSSKQKALQAAITMVSKIIIQYSKVKPLW